MQERQLSLSSLCSFLPEAKSCSLYNFDNLRHILIMFGRNEEEDQYACPVQERQLSLSSLCSCLP